MDRHSRHAGIVRVLWITLGLNLLVAVGKLLCALRYGHLSLQADGLHSLSDALANVIGLVGIRMAMRPPDEEHPYGHRKFELAVSLLISVSLFWAAWQVAEEAFQRWQGGNPPVPSGWVPFGVMIATVGINLWVSRYERREGLRLASPVLASDSAHTGSDVYASAAVLVSLGAAHFGIRRVDLVAALGIAGVIAWQGHRIFVRNLSMISDERVIDRGEIVRIVQAFPRVKTCHRIRTRGISDEIFLDLHVHVDPKMTVQEAHELSHQVEVRLRREFLSLHDVTIHVEPEGDPEE